MRRFVDRAQKSDLKDRLVAEEKWISALAATGYAQNQINIATDAKLRPRP